MFIFNLELWYGSVNLNYQSCTNGGKKYGIFETTK